jgi:hypothetical protein
VLLLPAWSIIHSRHWKAQIPHPAVDPLEQLRLARFDAREPLEHYALVEGDHQRHQRVERHLDPVALARLGEGLGEHRAPRGVQSHLTKPGARVVNLTSW